MISAPSASSGRSGSQKGMASQTNGQTTRAPDAWHRLQRSNRKTPTRRRCLQQVAAALQKDDNQFVGTRKHPGHDRAGLEHALQIVEHGLSGQALHTGAMIFGTLDDPQPIGLQGGQAGQLVQPARGLAFAGGPP
jgi:hypothetical protein